ncbi:MAG: hypothetical protein ABSG86_27935 [Thermoguttaceae bacterium]
MLVVGIVLVLVAAACLAAAAPAGRKVPPGAAALGYTKCVIDERPSVADVALDNKGASKWFNGLWCTPPEPRGKFEMVDGVPAIHPCGVLVSAPRDFSPRGRLPLLAGKDGFHVEFDVRLSENDHDHWPAVWRLPIEYDQKNSNQYEGDPPGRTRYMELDVDEGGMGPGMAGTVHSWVWRDGRVERRRHNPNTLLFTPLDRAKVHTFGASCDPTRTTVTWWLDAVKQMSTTKPYCPESAARQHFYLIMNATFQHKKDLDYRMFVSGVRAYVAPTSPLPAAAEAKEINSKP